MFGSWSNGDQERCARRSLINGKIALGAAAMLVERWMVDVSGLRAAMNENGRDHAGEKGENDKNDIHGVAPSG